MIRQQNVRANFRDTCWLCMGRRRTSSARVTDMEAERMNTEQREQADYMSYLMRVWRAPAGSDHTWRASLEETHTQEVHGFKDLQSLFAFLLAQTGQQDQQVGNVNAQV